MSKARVITEQELYDINIGAGFFGAGGGGSVELVRQLIPTVLKQANPPTLIDMENIGDDESMAVLGIIGAPEAEKAALQLNSFRYCTVRAFETLEELTHKKFKYIVPPETGSISIITPFLVSAVKNIPVTNGDGAGRAVPEIPDLLYPLGVTPTPATLANDVSPGDPGIQVTAVLQGPSLDNSCRGIISDDSFNQYAGIAFCAMNGTQFKKYSVTNTVQVSLDLGAALRTATGEYDKVVQAFLKSTLNRPSWVITTGTVQPPELSTKGGFDLGIVTIIGDDGKTYKACSQNENLLTWNIAENSPLVMAPDLVSYVSEKDGRTLSNADVKKGDRIHLIASPCDEKMRNPTIISNFEKLFQSIGYFGTYVPVETRLGAGYSASASASTSNSSATKARKSVSSPVSPIKPSSQISATASSKSLAERVSASSSPFPPPVDPLRKIHLRIILPVLYDQDFLDEFRTFYQTYNRPNVELDFVFLEAGARQYLVSDYDNAIDAPYVLRCVQQAMRDKVDGVLVCDMFDTGVIPSKHLSTIPVMGPLNASVGLAQNISGNKFGVVCISSREVRVNYRMAKTFQYLDRFVGAEPLNVDVMQLNADWDYTLAQALAAARKLIEKGADTILLGCTGMLGLAAKMTDQLGGVPVIDGAVTGLYLLEDEVRMGLMQSKEWYDLPENPIIMDATLPIYPLYPGPEEAKTKSTKESKKDTEKDKKKKKDEKDDKKEKEDKKEKKDDKKDKKKDKH